MAVIYPFHHSINSDDTCHLSPFDNDLNWTKQHHHILLQHLTALMMPKLWAEMPRILTLLPGGWLDIFIIIFWLCVHNQKGAGEAATTMAPFD